MNRILFTALADDDLDDIWLGIALENESAADRVVDEINEVTLKLVTFPHMGRAADMLRIGARLALLLASDDALSIEADSAAVAE